MNELHAQGIYINKDFRKRDKHPSECADPTPNRSSTGTYTPKQ